MKVTWFKLGALLYYFWFPTNSHCLLLCRLTNMTLHVIKMHFQLLLSQLKFVMMYEIFWQVKRLQNIKKSQMYISEYLSFISRRKMALTLQICAGVSVRNWCENTYRRSPNNVISYQARWFLPILQFQHFLFAFGPHNFIWMKIFSMWYSLLSLFSWPGLED